MFNLSFGILGLCNAVITAKPAFCNYLSPLPRWLHGVTNIFIILDLACLKADKFEGLPVVFCRTTKIFKALFRSDIVIMSAEETSPVAHILVVDDDHEICDLLARFLKKYNYRVSVAANGKEMARVLSQWSIDLVVLDIMMPGEDGLSLCRSLRAKSKVAIIMLTMMNEETDRIVGLEMGADDYLTKPFNPRELMARIKAVLRRTKTMPAGNANSRADVLSFAEFKLDISRRQLFSPDGLLIDLSSGEFDLLIALAEHSQQLLTRDQLLDITSGRTEAPFDRSIDMQISRLRRKIETGNKGPELIKTIRGAGYMLTEAATRQNGSS